MVSPCELVDRDDVPGTSSVMSLMRRGAEYLIWVDGRELMSDRQHGSEDALADLAFDRLADRPAARVLIGGLGMGFTLAAALRRLGPEGAVVVAELVPAVVRWNRGPAGTKAGHPVADPRTGVHAGDVAELVRAPPAPWDAILLDVDNGPTGLTRASNDWLYSAAGLDAAFAALAPGGVLGVWSAAPDAAFTRRLRRAGFGVEELPVRSRGSRGGHRHVVWIGTRRGPGARWTR
ncbi:MAG: spermidine synthase [Myxococcota bacterium]